MIVIHMVAGIQYETRPSNVGCLLLKGFKFDGFLRLGVQEAGLG